MRRLAPFPQLVAAFTLAEEAEEAARAYHAGLVARAEQNT